MRKIILCMLLSLALLLPAFAETDPQSEIAALNARIAELEALVAELEAQLAEQTKQYSPDDDVIIFDGGSVKLAVAQAAYDEMAAIYEEFGIPVSEYAEDIKNDILANLAEDAVLQMKAKELGVAEITPEQRAAAELDAQATYESMMSYYMPIFQDGTMTDEEVRAAAENYLHNQGMDYDDTLEDILSTLWHDALFAAVTADVTVADEDIRALYDSSLAEAKEMYADPMMYEYDCVGGEIIFHHPEGYRQVEYILIAYNDDEFAIENADDRIAALSERCAEILTRAQNGDDLTDMGEELALLDYGELPVSENSQLMPDEFTQTAMALQLGETSAPVDTGDGVWIIRHLADVTPGDVPFDSLKDVLAEAALNAAKQNTYNALVEQWISEANVTPCPEMIQE